MSLDPQTRDAIRKIPELERKVDALGAEINKLIEDRVLIKEYLRAIKKSVVRKYGSGEEDASRS